MSSYAIVNPIHKQMVERNEIRNIGQIEEIGEEQGAKLMTNRPGEVKCSSCWMIHRPGICDR